ncbi:MAG TPA: DHHA2 domain-containing protein [Anaerolineales bacterium]|nr:DHHA2 domain-containing protein [Anaerolineales bacterium]
MQPTPDRTFVIGHVNPDTDSIAAAMGYAWFLREVEGKEYIAARAGPLNPQTTWVMQKLALDPPLLLPDASPRFAAIATHMNTTPPDRPLREAWTIANRTGGVAPLVNEDGTPFGLVNSLSMFGFLSRSVGPHPRREQMQIGEILNRPAHEASDNQVPVFRAGSRIRDALPRIYREERNEFWVVDDEGRYVGICRQRDALNPPRVKLILVDHNEAGQALGALEEADLLEILDHHRLGNPSTHIPIRFTVDIVGSTSTLVSERIEDAGLSAPPALAGLLLAGLLSDTLILTSPTTTPRDHRAAERLGRWAFGYGAPLEGETVQSFGQQLIQAGAGLASRKPEEIVTADLKLYEAGGLDFGIAQVEVTNLNQLGEHLEKLSQALRALRDSKGLNFAMLMVTDVVQGTSRLLLTDEVAALGVLPFSRLEDNTLLADGVVSRKKQLLPAVLSALEG